MVDEKDLPSRGDVVAGKYQIDGVLGSGGMGAVFRATHRVTGKSFAIKWLLPQLRTETDAVNRFIREAQVAGRVDHPNVVEVYDVGQEGQSFYMVMELLHGESLAQRIASKGRLSAQELAQILIPVTRGLSAAHAAGVIHRDLKPDNIFLCHGHEGAPEVPKVLDFGISKISALSGEVQAGITRQGAVMGTPHYMAPEQIRSQPVDARTDVYALGVILYQGLSGEVPFPGDSYADLVLKIVGEAPKPLAVVAPRTPTALITLVERAMSRDPAQRPATAQELGAALQPFAAGPVVESQRSRARGVGSASSAGSQTPLSTESHVGLQQVPRPAGARRGVYVGAGAAAIGVLVAASVWLGRPAAAPTGPGPTGPVTAGVQLKAAPTPPVAAARDEGVPAAPSGETELRDDAPTAAPGGEALQPLPELPRGVDAPPSEDELPTPNTVNTAPEVAPKHPPSGPPTSPQPTEAVTPSRPGPAAPVAPSTAVRPPKPVKPAAPQGPARRTQPLTVDDF
ncbi:MAG: protein kinase [Polyangiales bacterium]